MTVLLALLSLAHAKKPAPVQAAPVPTVNVPHEAFTLPNGLRVIVTEDHKAPVVAVSVWYGVGSRDEPEGRTGFAHLFEHLMFNGSENFKGEFFEPFAQVGATDQNGTTWFDRTNYFQTVPTPALELALWMESDRMGHLLGAVDQATLDEQRGVVQNEKRQGDNQPYGQLEYHVLAGVFPEGHPYRHSTIGSMADLEAASLDDVKGWFQEYYGAANTVLVLAGDTTAAAAKPLVEKYFGDIAAGPPLSRVEQWVPERRETVRETLWDDVPQVRVQRVWAVPGRVTKDRAMLDLAAAILGQGKNSRLFEELVYERQLATRATASVEPHQLASLFTVDVTVAPGKDPAEVEAAIDQVVATFLEAGPTSEELVRARTSIGAELVRDLEKVGGFGGKATVLAEGALYAGDAAFFTTTRVGWLNSAGVADVAATAKRWLGGGHYQVQVRPYDGGELLATTADRSKLPEVPAPPALVFPEVREAKLANGARLVVAERHAIPEVHLSVQFDAGFASDPVGKRGLASFAAGMLDEGTKSLGTLQLAAELESLGAVLTAVSQLDTTTVTVSALTTNLDASAKLWADVIRNPAFDDKELERQRSRWIANIAQEEADPAALAMRLLPPELYGADHPYGGPLTGSGDVASIQSLTRRDLQDFHERWLRPDNATVFVVGDTTLEKVLPVLNAALGDWKAPKDALPTKALAAPKPPTNAKIILLDKPGAEQSLILAGRVLGPGGGPDDILLDATNDVLGGEFTARLNMNLREDKHWAYGAYTFLVDAGGPRPLIAFAPVQTDKTAESLVEVHKELQDVIGPRPPTAEELELVVNNSVLSLPGSFESAAAVLGSLRDSAQLRRPWNWPATVAPQYEALTVASVAQGAKSLVATEQFVWLIVGDVAKIEAAVRATNLGPVEVRSL